MVFQHHLYIRFCVRVPLRGQVQVGVYIRLLMFSTIKFRRFVFLCLDDVSLPFQRALFYSLTVTVALGLGALLDSRIFRN